MVEEKNGVTTMDAGEMSQGDSTPTQLKKKKEKRKKKKKTL